MVGDIVKQEAIWRKTWKHPEPLCKQWIEREWLFGKGFCKHYVKARREQFKNEVEALLDVSTEKVFKWVYISNQ